MDYDTQSRELNPHPELINTPNLIAPWASWAAIHLKEAPFGGPLFVVALENFRNFDLFQNPSAASGMGLGHHLVPRLVL